MGTQPEFGNAHLLSPQGFYKKLKRRFLKNGEDATFLDRVFRAMGYNGFQEADKTLFTNTTIPNGMIGNMGYTEQHKIQFVQLNASREKDLKAFKIKAKNGCDVHFMKTCGNLFFFCSF